MFDMTQANHYIGQSVPRMRRHQNKFSLSEDSKLQTFFSTEHTQEELEAFARELGRSVRSVRERYNFYLSKRRPDKDEDIYLIKRKVNELGPRWSLISEHYFKNTSPYIIRDIYNSIGKPKFNALHPNYRRYKEQHEDTVSETPDISSSKEMFDFKYGRFQ